MTDDANQLSDAIASLEKTIGGHMTVFDKVRAERDQLRKHRDDLLHVATEHVRPLLGVAYLAARTANDTEFMRRLEAADIAITAAITQTVED